MIDPRLNLFWSYNVPDGGSVDSGLGTHEDNLTRGLVVTLRLLGPEATTAFLAQVGVPVEGTVPWRYNLHRSVSKGPTEQGFLLGVHAEGDVVDPRSLDAHRRVPDAVFHAQDRYYVLIEAKKRGDFHNDQLAGHFKTLGEEVASDQVRSHRGWKPTTWGRVAEILSNLEGTAGGKLVAKEFVSYLRLQGLVDEFEADIFEAQVKLWQETHQNGDHQRKFEFEEVRSLVAEQLDRLAAKTGGETIWEAPGDNDTKTASKLKRTGRFYHISHGDRFDVSIRRKPQPGDPKSAGLLAAWANGDAAWATGDIGSTFLWGVSWYSEAKGMPNLPFEGNFETSIVCAKDSAGLRKWEDEFDKAASDFARQCPSMAAARDRVIQRLRSSASLNLEDATSRVALTARPIMMHPSKYLWRGAQVDAEGEITLGCSDDIERKVRALFQRPSADAFPEKGAAPASGFAEWRRAHRYQKAALSLSIKMDGLLANLKHDQQLQRFWDIREALIEAMRPASA